MPFVAIHKETGERVDITELEDPRAELKSGEYVCQLCGAPLLIKAGLIVIAHFAHYAGECQSDYKAHPESPEHRFAKHELKRILKAQFAGHSEATIQLEVPI